MSTELKRLQKRHWELVDKICDLLESADLYKALNALRKVLREREEYRDYCDQVIEILGVDNIGNALSRLKATGMVRSVYSTELPPELCRVPQIWLEGRNRDGRDPGFARFGYYEAEREYKRLRPLLEEVWEAIETEPEEFRERLRADIVKDYETHSPEEMGRYCIAFVNNYDLKEIVERDKTPAPLALPTEEEVTESLRLVTDPNLLYGVVSKDKMV